MSTRWYPIYQRGGPQLRVFLPNFWMKLVRSPHNVQPPNVAVFSCSMEMTKHDIKNYLEKIYKVNCVEVRTRIALGKTRRDPGKGYIVKDDDIKYAFITMPITEKFEYPDLFPKTEKQEEDERSMNEMKKAYKDFTKKNEDRPNMPGWFTV